MSQRIVKFTEHGKQRATEMGLTRRDVLEVVLHYEKCWRSVTLSQEPRTTYVKGGIAVVLADSGKVITCLLHKQEQWDRAVDQPEVKK